MMPCTYVRADRRPAGPAVAQLEGPRTDTKAELQTGSSKSALMEKSGGSLCLGRVWEPASAFRALAECGGWYEAAYVDAEESLLVGCPAWLRSHPTR